MRKNEMPGLIVFLVALVLLFFGIALLGRKILTNHHIETDSQEMSPESNTSDSDHDVSSGHIEPDQYTYFNKNSDYVEPMDPNAGPQSMQPNNPDFGGGPNEHINKKPSSEPPESPSEYVPPHPEPPKTDDAASNEKDAASNEKDAGDNTSRPKMLIGTAAYTPSTPKREMYKDPTTGKIKDGVITTGESSERMKREGPDSYARVCDMDNGYKLVYLSNLDPGEVYPYILEIGLRDDGIVARVNDYDKSLKGWPIKVDPVGSTSNDISNGHISEVAYSVAIKKVKQNNTIPPVFITE